MTAGYSTMQSILSFRGPTQAPLPLVVIRATFVGFVLFLGGFVPFYWKQIHWGNCGKLWPSFWEALALFMGNRLIVGRFVPFYGNRLIVGN